MKKIIILFTIFVAGISQATTEPYSLSVRGESDFIFYNSNYNAFKNEPTNGYYRTYGLESLEANMAINHSNGVGFDVSLRPDALIDRQVDETVPTEFDTRAGVVYVAKSELKFLNTYQLSYMPNKNFKFSLGVFFDFEPNRSAYEPILEFGLNTLFPQKFAALKISWQYQKDFNSYPDSKSLVKTGFDIFIMNTKDERHEALKPNNKTDDTANASEDDYFGLGVRGFVPASENLNILASVAYVAGKNLSYPATQSQILASFAVRYRLNLFGNSSLLAYELRFDKDTFTQSSINIPSLIQYSQSLTATHQLSSIFDLLIGLHQGASDNLTQNYESKIMYKGIQLDMSLRHKVKQNLVIDYWVDYEYRTETDGGSTKGGFTIGESDSKYLFRYAIRASYLFDS